MGSLKKQFPEEFEGKNKVKKKKTVFCLQIKKIFFKIGNWRIRFGEEHEDIFLIVDRDYFPKVLYQKMKFSMFRLPIVGKKIKKDGYTKILVEVDFDFDFERDMTIEYLVSFISELEEIWISLPEVNEQLDL